MVEVDTGGNGNIQQIPGGATEEGDLTRLTTSQLFGLLTRKATLLMERQIELTKTEIQADIQAEITVGLWFGIAGGVAMIASALLCASLVLGLTASGLMAAWLAALLLAIVLMVLAGVAALIGWGRHVASPLRATQLALLENWRWARKRAPGGAS